VTDLAPIVERCRAGDALAWEALVRRVQGRVYAVAFHYLCDAEEARDLAQEVFIKVYRSLDTFSGESFLPWLLRLGRNAAIDRLRRKKARPQTTELPAGAGSEIAAAGPSPEESWAAEARRRLVHRALQRMSEPNRELIMLKEIQGLDLEAIASLLDVPLGTVKSRSNRARLELARKVMELDPSYGST